MEIVKYFHCIVRFCEEEKGENGVDSISCFRNEDLNAHEFSNAHTGI